VALSSWLCRPAHGGLQGYGHRESGRIRCGWIWIPCGWPNAEHHSSANELLTRGHGREGLRLLARLVFCARTEHDTGSGTAPGSTRRRLDRAHGAGLQVQSRNKAHGSPTAVRRDGTRNKVTGEEEERGNCSSEFVLTGIDI